MDAIHEKQDFTQGNILKKLLLFMLPVFGALVLQAMYGAVDLFVVGRFGTTAGLSGVSTGSQVLNLVTFVITGLAMGLTIQIGHYMGEKRPDKIGPLIGAGVITFLVISAILCVAMVGGAHTIATLMQAPKEAINETMTYIRICGAGGLILCGRLKDECRWGCFSHCLSTGCFRHFVIGHYEKESFTIYDEEK